MTNHHKGDPMTQIPTPVNGKRMLLIGIMLSGAFIAVLNQTVLSPALPSIMEDMGITAVEGQWLTTAFMLVNGIMIPVAAYLINRFTTRQLFLTSMLIFTGGALLAGFTHSFAVLLLARVLQAMSAGIMMPMIQTVLMLIFPREKRGSAMGTVGIVISFAPAIGPTLSGFLVDAWGWNSVFLVIAPLSGIVVLCGFVLLKNVGEAEVSKLDIPSVIFSTLGFGGLLYGCSNAGSAGWAAPLTIAPLLVGVVFLVLFIRRQGRLEVPLLRLHILRNKVFACSTIIGMIINAALIAGTIITPIYLQNIVQFSALQSGIIMLPGAIVMGVMSPITGRLFDRFGPRVLSISGLSIMTGFTICFVIMDENWTFPMLCAVYTFRMFGMSLVNMPLNTWGMNALENRVMAHGSAINNTARQVAGSIGTAILITIMSMVSAACAGRGEVEATLAGIHGAFGTAMGISAVALVMAILFVKQPKYDDDDIFV